MMNQETYLKIFAAECQEEVDLTTRKNADYASNDNAFKNFQAIEFLTDGNISLEEGIIVRITDKFQRAINLLSREAKVADEKITDTLRDISVYARILRIYILHEKKQEVILGATKPYNGEARLIADFNPGIPYRSVMIGGHVLMFDGNNWVCKDCDSTLQTIMESKS